MTDESMQQHREELESIIAEVEESKNAARRFDEKIDRAAQRLGRIQRLYSVISAQEDSNSGTKLAQHHGS